MGFMAGFAEVITQQYNRGQDKAAEQEKVALQEKLRIADDERTVRMKQKEQERQWEQQANLLAAKAGSPESKSFFMDELRLGRDPDKMAERIDNGDFIVPEKTVKVSSSPKTILDEAYPIEPAPAVKTAPTSGQPKFGDTTNTPVPAAVSDPAAVGTTPETPATTEMPDPISTSKETKAETKVADERTPTKVAQANPVGSNKKVDEVTLADSPNKFGFRPDPKDIKVGSLNEERVRLSAMENGKNYSPVQITQQRAKVKFLEDSHLEDIRRDAAAKAEAEGKNVQWLTRIDKNTGNIIETRAYTVSGKDEDGNPIITEIGENGKVRPVALGENESWAPADENTNKTVLQIKEKMYPDSVKIANRTSAFASSVDYATSMTDILMDPANKDMLTSTVDIGLNSLATVNQELNAISNIFFNEKDAATKGDVTIDPDMADSMLERARQAESIAMNLLPTISDANKRLVVQRAVYENYRIAMAYKLAAANDQTGNAVSTKDFQMFYNMAGGSTPQKAAQNIVNQLQKQASQLLHDQRAFQTNIENLSSQTGIKGKITFNLPRLGNIFEEGTSQNAYMQNLLIGVKKKTGRTSEEYQKFTSDTAEEPVEEAKPGAIIKIEGLGQFRVGQQISNEQGTFEVTPKGKFRKLSGPADSTTLGHQ